MPNILAIASFVLWMLLDHVFDVFLEGPPGSAKSVEAHHTVVFSDGDRIEVENQVSLSHNIFQLKFFFSLNQILDDICPQS